MKVVLFLLVIASISMIEAACPNYDDFDIMAGDVFRCAEVWEGEGDPDPTRACYDCGGGSNSVTYPDGTYGSGQNPDPDRYYVGSIYVWPGCSFKGWRYDGYGQDHKTLTGKYVNYDYDDAWTTGGCGDHFRSMQCTCTQKPINCDSVDDAYSALLICDNLAGVSDTYCEYQITKGTSYTTTIEEHMGISTTIQSELQSQYMGFMFGIGVSQTTSYDWTTTTSETYDFSTTVTVGITVPPGIVTTIDQVVGFCYNSAGTVDNTSFTPEVRTSSSNGTHVIRVEKFHIDEITI